MMLSCKVRTVYWRLSVPNVRSAVPNRISNKKIRYIVYLFYRLQGGLQDGTQRREFGENVQVPPKDEPGWE